MTYMYFKLLSTCNASSFVSMQCFYIILIILQFLTSYVVTQKAELIFVHVLFRHGDRTPIKGYPSDPYGNESFWPNGYGQLTNRGKLQQYELGQWLRNRYKTFLTDKYSPNDIYVFSSDYDRTLMSAEANLAGLYPQISTDLWNPNTTWQPIPVHTNKKEDDAIVACNEKCKRFDIELVNVQQSEDVAPIYKEMKPLLKYLANSTGVESVNWNELVTMYDNLYIQSLYNYTLPIWSKDVFPYPMKKYHDWGFKLETYNSELQRLKAGLLLNEIIERFVNKTTKELKPDRKMWIYSGHDTTLANILNTLGNFDPPFTVHYANAIIMELLVQNGVYYVSILFKNDSNARQLSIKGCEKLCALDKLKDLLKPVLITSKEWEKECISVPVPKVLTVIGIIGICCGVLFVSLFIIFCCRRMYANRYRISAE